MKTPTGISEFTDYRNAIEYLQSLSDESYKHSLFVMGHPTRYSEEETSKSISQYGYLKRALDIMSSLRTPVDYLSTKEFFDYERTVYVEYREKDKIKKRVVENCIPNYHFDDDGQVVPTPEDLTIKISSKKKSKYFTVGDYNKTYRFWMALPNDAERKFPWEYDERFDEVDDDIAE